MAKGLKYVVSVMFCLLFLGGAVFYAADVSAQESEKPKDLGEWWLRSPLSYDPMPSQWLYHFEGSYNWSRKTGNDTMDNHRAKANMVLRKNRFTSILDYTFDKRNSAKAKDYPNDNEDTEIRGDVKHDVHEALRFALTKKLYGTVGGMWMRDEVSLIQDRYTYYVGVGGSPIQTDKFVVNLLCAYGHEELDYTDKYHKNSKCVMSEDLQCGLSEKFWKTAEEIDYEEGTRKYELVYLSQSFDWKITDSVSFKEWFDIFQDTADSDKYRWALDLSFDIALMNHVSFSPNYHEEYNNEPGLGTRPETFQSALL